jgi:GH24 family phage-related lysozyme (muramidase)
MEYAAATFPDLASIADAVAQLEPSPPADFEALTAAANGIWAYVARDLSADQWTALLSLALDLGADTVGTSFFLRRLNVGDDAGAQQAFAGLGGDPARRASEAALLFP